jgi:hypothetical protein
VRVQDYQFRLCILPLDDFGNKYLVTLNHCIDHASECPLVLSTAHGKDNVNSSHEVMTRDFGHVSKAQELELLLIVALMLNLDSITVFIFISSLSSTILTGSTPRLVLQDALLLPRDRHQLLPIVIGLDLLSYVHRFLIRVIYLSRCPLDLHEAIFSIGRVRSHTTLLLQGRESFLSGAREDLDC